MVYQAVQDAITLWDVIVPQLPQKAETPLRLIARALGLKVAEVEGLMKSPVNAKALLNLNRLAQYRHLAIANRVWPHCTWFDWRVECRGLHPVLDLITRVFGRDLLDYVGTTYGDQVVLDYWQDLTIPEEYDDLDLDPEADDPLEGPPEEQFAFNEHIPDDEDGKFFVFGSVARGSVSAHCPSASDCAAHRPLAPIGLTPLHQCSPATAQDSLDVRGGISRPVQPDRVQSLQLPHVSGLASACCNTATSSSLSTNRRLAIPYHYARLLDFVDQSRKGTTFRVTLSSAVVVNSVTDPNQ